MSGGGVSLVQMLAFSIILLCLVVVPVPGHADHRSQYDYVVLTENQPIGTHRVNIQRKGNDFEIKAETDLEVGFGPLTVFRFEHQRRELWHNWQLVESIAHTVKNDKIYDIKITRQATGYKRVVNGREDKFEDPVSILALWHSDLFTHHIFISPLEDKLYRLSVQFVDREQIEIGDQWVQALHYQMTGDSERDLWYDESGHVLKVRLHDYSLVIDYVLDRGNLGHTIASKSPERLYPARSKGR